MTSPLRRRPALALLGIVSAVGLATPVQMFRQAAPETDAGRHFNISRFAAEAQQHHNAMSLYWQIDNLGIDRKHFEADFTRETKNTDVRAADAMYDAVTGWGAVVTAVVHAGLGGVPASALELAGAAVAKYDKVVFNELPVGTQFSIREADVPVAVVEDLVGNRAMTIVGGLLEQGKKDQVERTLLVSLQNDNGVKRKDVSVFAATLEPDVEQATGDMEREWISVTGVLRTGLDVQSTAAAELKASATTASQAVTMLQVKAKLAALLLANPAAPARTPSSVPALNDS